jgi:hypothetical protein
VLHVEYHNYLNELSFNKNMNMQYLLGSLWEVAEDMGAIGGGLGQGIPLKTEVLKVRKS